MFLLLDFKSFCFCHSVNFEMVFEVIDFLQKTNEQIRLYYYDISGRLVFVRFLEEIYDPKPISKLTDLYKLSN